MKKIVSAVLALALALGLCGAFAESSALPAYVYPFADEDPVMAAVTEYLVSTDLGYTPEEGGILVPAPIELKREMNAEGTEATVYGNFWVFCYRLNGTVLETTSGGENPGVMKLEKKDGKWVVTSLEVAESGDEAFKESLIRFAAGDKQLEEDYFKSSDATDGYLPQFRRSFLVEYVNANKLDITAYQDYGWDPVDLTL